MVDPILVNYYFTSSFILKGNADGFDVPFWSLSWKKIVSHTAMQPCSVSYPIEIGIYDFEIPFEGGRL